MFLKMDRLTERYRRDAWMERFMYEVRDGGLHGEREGWRDALTGGCLTDSGTNRSEGVCLMEGCTDRQMEGWMYE